LLTLPASEQSRSKKDKENWLKQLEPGKRTKSNFEDGVVTHDERNLSR
jgi:hypothetical protein